MSLKIVILVACILATVAEEDQGVANRMPNTTQVATTTQSTGALATQSDTMRLPEDKRQVLKTGQNKTRCYCDGKAKVRLTPGCPCKSSARRQRAGTRKAVKKNPKKKGRKQRKDSPGRKKRIPKHHVSTPI